jgi:hypothetical protein
MQDFDPSKLTETLKAVEPFPSGITTHSGNRFFDNSTLDSMRVCPRRFYFSKIRKWKQDRDSIALLFGSAWHATMDYLWQHPSSTPEQAIVPFQKMWDSSEFADSLDFDSFPRTPMRAFEMLTRYIERYQNWLINDIELVAVEKSFIVPLSEHLQKLFYIGNWDKVYKERNFYHIADHKTSSSFASSWLNSWSPNGQVDGYLYGGHMYYGDQFKSVMIDGALVQKTSIDFRRVPIERQTDMLEQWKWEVIDLIEQIIYYENRLLELRQSGQAHKETTLRTFPKCTTSCTSYYGSCPYLDLCKYVPNPESYTGDDIPNGYVIDTWQAFHIEETPSGEFVIKPHERGE